MKIAVLASISKTQFYVNQAYTDYVSEAGMFPVIIPPNMSPEMALGVCDGLLLPGGIDLDPIYYGEDNDHSYTVDPKKDAFERSMFHTFREAGRPVFGICRGFQLIAREYLSAFPEMLEFLSFWDDISQHNQTGGLSLARDVHSHFVDFVPDYVYGDATTKLSSKAKIETMPVNSMHHQCLYADFVRKGVVGAMNFRMGAWATRGLKVDKKMVKEKKAFPVICEAFRIKDWGGPIAAVQWHPEELKDIELLQNFFLSNFLSNEAGADSMVAG